VPGGRGQVIRFAAGNVSRTEVFEVAPRVKVIYPGPSAQRGQLVEISLRGYGPHETVRIRWQDGDGIGWRQIATVVTSSTGSANTTLPVPSFARNGVQSVRGDGPLFRQQTNVVTIQSGPGPTASIGPRVAAFGQPVPGLPKEFPFITLPFAGIGMSARRILASRFRA
jgi:hypothetical protein